jgi:hypothetical protein
MLNKRKRLFRNICLLVLTAGVALVGFYCQTRNAYQYENVAEKQRCENDLQNSSTPIDAIPSECFFSDDYFEARTRFIRFAALAGAETFSFKEVSPGVATDVAVIAGHPAKFLIHISGTHGTEGYTGSAIQSAWLLRQSRGDAANQSQIDAPTVVLVHALNAFGFANNRRVDEGNVDLNRNFLSERDRALVTARDPNFAG